MMYSIQIYIISMIYSIHMYISVIYSIHMCDCVCVCDYVCVCVCKDRLKGYVQFICEGISLYMQIPYFSNKH